MWVQIWGVLFFLKQNSVGVKMTNGLFTNAAHTLGWMLFWKHTASPASPTSHQMWSRILGGNVLKYLLKKEKRQKTNVTYTHGIWFLQPAELQGGYIAYFWAGGSSSSVRIKPISAPSTKLEARMTQVQVAVKTLASLNLGSPEDTPTHRNCLEFKHHAFSLQVLACCLLWIPAG